MNKQFLSFLVSIFLPLTLFAGNISIEKGGWSIKYDEVLKTFNYKFLENPVFTNAYPEAIYDISEGSDIRITPSSFSTVSLSSENIEDNFGSGTVYTVKFENQDLKVSLEQRFYIYDLYSYFLTEISLTGINAIRSNYLAPVVSNTTTKLLTANSYNRMLFIPWDNDGFIRYESRSLSGNITSYEVTSVFEGIDRNGLVVGSVEHDTWKSAIDITASGNQNLDKIRCYSGASSSITRDKLPHGKVSGKTVRSAKMFVGFFDDWRIGMEAYGHANTLIVPARNSWKKGTPFGWNSWGVIAEKLNYIETIEVSNFFKQELYDEGFHNEQNNVIIDLDSFWDNMGSSYLRQFALKCKQNGQIPGIYWCPFSYWGGDLNSYVEGTSNQYKYSDCVLYVNGTAHSQGGYCVDPTHPAIKQRMIAQFEKFKSWGFEYIKLDFVTNGAIQADSYYDENVTTGMQAYNRGFQDILDVVGDDMFISLSIAPMFPYQYGNSRRISCDAWGTIGHTQYVANCLSFGWWANQFYQYNDPDHIVLISDSPGNETEGENRARVTSGAITGMLLFGDNFSTNTERGNPALSKERAMIMMTNPDINEMGRLGKSFKPVYAYKATTNGADNFFMYHTDKYLYVACISYTSSTLYGTIPLDLLDITESDIVSIKELWTGDNGELSLGKLRYSVPGKDARVYRIEKSGSGIEHIKKESEWVKISQNANTITLDSTQPMQEIALYNVTGNLVKKVRLDSSFHEELNTSSIGLGVYILSVDAEKRNTQRFKLFIGK